MKKRVVILMILLLCGVGVTHVMAQSKDHGAAVAGIYEGDTFIELLQQELKLKLELKRIDRDSVMVVITDFLLPTGQKFNFKSKLSVKPEIKGGETIYRLNADFTYNYNNMPIKITAIGTIKNGELDSEVKANLMEAMETKVTYRAKKRIEGR